MQQCCNCEECPIGTYCGNNSGITTYPIGNALESHIEDSANWLVYPEILYVGGYYIQCILCNHKKQCRPNEK